MDQLRETDRCLAPLLSTLAAGIFVGALYLVARTLPVPNLERIHQDHLHPFAVMLRMYSQEQATLRDQPIELRPEVRRTQLQRSAN